METKTIHSTTNYSMFKIMKGNRTISEPHVQRLMISFKQKYLISPIIINRNNEVIDGQHRLEAAKRLSLPIYYIIDGDYNLSDVQILNSNNRTWSQTDYLNSYCELGNKDYLQLKEFMTNYPDFGISATISIMSNLAGSPNTSVNSMVIRTTPFENGKFKVFDIGIAYKNAAEIMRYKEFYSGFNRGIFVRTMIGLFKLDVFNNDLMIKKLSMQPTALVHCQSVSQYKLLIESIYNYKNRNKVNLRY